jgi:hypothetical protein
VREFLRQTGLLAGLSHDVLQRADAQGPAALSGEHIRAVRRTPQLAQVTQFVAVHRMRAVFAHLAATDGNRALVQVQMVPAQIAGFRRAQAMPVDQADKDTISFGVSATLAGGCDQTVSLVGRQVQSFINFALFFG